MSWLRIDLRGVHVPMPHDCGGARARRLELRQRLLRETGLTGAAALAIVREVRALELREAVESLRELP
jgi:hypothetical protein